MKVAIVGAGVAGLSAARQLKKDGHTPIVFERENVVGGRCASRNIGNYLFDAGATSIAPKSPLSPLSVAMLTELDSSDLEKIAKPIFVHEMGRVTTGDSSKNAMPRYVYRSGINRLCQLLAKGIDIRFSTMIDHFEAKRSLYELGGEEFDAIIIAIPTPLANSLLEASGESRPLRNSSFRPCLSVLLGFGFDLHDTKFHAIIDAEQRHPLGWLSIESAKCSGRAPDGCTAMVAQMSAPFSKMHFDDDAAVIVDQTLDYVSRLFGKAWNESKVFDVVRWRYAQPEMTVTFDGVNLPGSRLLLIGDGLAGPRIENAYETGIKAARMISNLV